jgi:hypothetical protein
VSTSGATTPVPSVTLAMLDRCCTDLAAVLDGPPGVAVRRIRTDLHGPLAVAVAGDARSGVSTLLNALAGERLAPAGTPTPAPVRYVAGPALAAVAVFDEGDEPVPVRRRPDGAVEVVADRDTDGPFRYLDVEVPMARSRLTLVDAGGWRPTEPERSVAARSLAGPRGAWRISDAVIHVAAPEATGSLRGLGPLLDEILGVPSARDAIAVVGRADELGDGGRDAPGRAGRLAAELRARPPYLLACSTVLAVSGLLGEAAARLDPDDVATLVRLLSEPPDELAQAIVSVDAFCHPARSAVSVERRHQLVSTLGLSGVRLALRTLHGDGDPSVDELAARLRAASGVDRLDAEIDRRFVAHRDDLKSATALARLRALLGQLPPGRHDEVAARVAATLDAREHQDPRLAERRVLRLVAAGVVHLSQAEVREVAAVLVGETIAERLGRPPDADPAELGDQIAAAQRRWAVLASSPANDGALGDVCAAVLRRYDADAVALARP